MIILLATFFTVNATTSFSNCLSSGITVPALSVSISSDPILDAELVVTFNILGILSEKTNLTFQLLISFNTIDDIIIDPNQIDNDTIGLSIVSVKAGIVSVNLTQNIIVPPYLSEWYLIKTTISNQFGNVLG
ncbi:3198_t:CDS:1, partial [Scutellospora calospora]